MSDKQVITRTKRNYRVDKRGIPITCILCGHACQKQYERLDKGKPSDYCCSCIYWHRNDLITKPIEDWICPDCLPRKEASVNSRKDLEMR